MEDEPLWKNDNRLLILAAAAALLACGACSKPRDIAAVHGKVTFRGEPLTEGLVIFEDKELQALVSAKILPDGTYRVKVMEGDGLYLGNYTIRVMPPILDQLEMSKTPPKQKLYPNIPARYRSAPSSGLRLIVGAGDNPFDIDMKP
jgi:hypothetical protein